MKTISDAVILMAGSGSRLRGLNKAILKPFIPLAGRPLISYTVEMLAHAGIKKINFVVGYESKRVRARVKHLGAADLEFCFIENPDWRRQNGISALAAADHVTAPFLLTMSDHLFDPSIVDLLLGGAAPAKLNLAIDRKIGSIFDLEDAMKVRTHRDRLLAIGKDLKTYDAIDTGLLLCPLEIFEYLERAKKSGDCSLADGVRLMAIDGNARAIDIENAWWQDIDTPAMLARAETQLRSRPACHDIAMANAGSDRSNRAEN